MKESELIFGLMVNFNKNEFSFADILWLTNPFNVSETTLRTNLARMVTNKALMVRKKGRKAFYSLTIKSKKISSNVSMSFNSPDWSSWKGNWWGVSISLPTYEKNQRYLFGKKLAKHRFALLHPGFWIRPFNKNEKQDKRLKDVFENKYTKVILFDFFSDDDLTNLQSLWKIGAINRKFYICINYISECHKTYNLKNSKEALVAKMTVGDKVVKQLFEDPLLPKQFLPTDWQGENLRNSFREWDKLTTEKSKPYWIQIFNTKIL